MSNDTTNNLPPGWETNPARWPRRLRSAALALAGCAIATYLALGQIGVVDQVWEPFFGDGSHQILHSGFADAFPVPDAALGALAYLAEAGAGLIGGTGRWRSMPWITLAYGLLAIGLGVTGVGLLIAQPVLYNDWCTLCIASAVVSALMVGPALEELLASLQHLRRTHDAGESLWFAVWGVHTRVETAEP